MNWSLRPIEVSELAAVHELQRRVEERDHIPVVTPLKEFEEWLEDPHFDLATDSCLAEFDGQVIAWGKIWHRPSAARADRAYVVGAVHPDFRSQSIGRTLLRWQLERATEIMRASPSAERRCIRTRAFDFELSAIRLYQRHGMVPVRYGDEMLRDLNALPETPVPADVTIVPWDRTRSEAARHAQNEAFADHWGSTPMDQAAWEHDSASHGSRLDLSFMAMDGDQVVGVCRNGYYPADEAVTGRKEGWIRQVSVTRTHRRRGIASALVVASMRAFRGAGLTHAALGVDSENLTGAYQIYERLGFRRIHRTVTHELVV